MGIKLPQTRLELRNHAGELQGETTDVQAKFAAANGTANLASGEVF
jgi:hypothetical protein